MRASNDVIDEYEQHLTDEGMTVQRTDGDEPEQEAGVRFDLPSGVLMEIVAVVDEEYQHFEEAYRAWSGQAPADIDHIQFLTPTLIDDLKFLQKMICFKVSDIAGRKTPPKSRLCGVITSNTT